MVLCLALALCGATENWNSGHVNAHYQERNSFSPTVTSHVSSLDLQNVDFSQDAGMWQNLARARFPYLKCVNLSNAATQLANSFDPNYFGSNQFLRELQENKTLLSLNRIEAKGCGIDAQTILGFRDGFLARDHAHADPSITSPLMRDTLQISGGYNVLVAPIHFCVDQTEISALRENLERYGQGIKVDKPKRVYRATSVMDSAIVNAYLQVTVSTA